MSFNLYRVQNRFKTYSWSFNLFYTFTFLVNLIIVLEYYLITFNILIHLNII